MLVEDSRKLVNYLPDIGIKKVRQEIWNGLNAIPKYILPKFFYDEKGSELFEAITRLEEYYLTRTEKHILSILGNKLDIDFTDLNIVELGSGSPDKIRLLLQKIPADQLSTLHYYPVDISQSSIERSAGILADEFPMININGIVADFVHQLYMIPGTRKRLFCFFGSTIGNLNTNEMKDFMKLLGTEMQIGDSLLLGMDMVKDTTVLINAYNDNQQITARFNKNILNVVNNLTDTNFDSADFEHLAIYNKENKRIEMYLRAKKEMVIHFNSNGYRINVKKEEMIHTENSHKFDHENIKTLGLWAGLDTEKIFTDGKQWFSLVHYKKTR